VFTESAVEAQCLRCSHAENAEKLRPRRIYDYVPNPKTHRAVEYGRIQGLDIQSVLFQDSSRAFRRDFLIFEIDREIYRARRYESALSLALVDVHGLERAAGVEGEADLERLRAEMLEQVAGTLRDLDVVSTVDETWAAVLLPETPLEAAMAVGRRLHRSISEYQSVSLSEPPVVTVAVGELGEEHEEGRQFFEYVRRILAWARQSRPGTVVSAQTWKEEAPDA
jgi:GGDEF domain-containing protein